MWIFTHQGSDQCVYLQSSTWLLSCIVCNKHELKDDTRLQVVGFMVQLVLYSALDVWVGILTELS